MHLKELNAVWRARQAANGQGKEKDVSGGAIISLQGPLIQSIQIPLWGLANLRGSHLCPRRPLGF